MADSQLPNGRVGDDVEESEEYEEDEEEEEEPRLKYQRLGLSVAEILKAEMASCLAAHEKFLALGTHWGAIHILDFQGNEIKRFNSHSTTVNELDIDTSGEYVASCSDDGKVVVHGLYNSEQHDYEYNGPIASIALEPHYAKSDKSEFVCGGKTEKLVHNTKGWFGRKNEVLHSGEGPIHAVKWRGQLIAWANNVGIKIYDCATKDRITFIPRPAGSPRPDMHRCSLVWENDTDLIIAWGNFVKIGRVTTDPGSHMRRVVIISEFKTDSSWFISGIAPFKNDLVVLAYIPAREQEAPVKPGAKPILSQRPELRIITRSAEEVTSDSLAILDFEHYKSTDYRLAYIAAEELFCIVSPKDIVMARPPDLDDHISWLISVERYEEALESARSHERELKSHKVNELGQKYLHYLLENDMVEQAGAQCSKILQGDQQLWEDWVFKFSERGHLRAISSYIPLSNPTLSVMIYEMVLNDFLISDSAGFLRLVNTWPSTLYKLQNVINAVKDRIEKSKDPNTQKDLNMALAKLYIHDKHYDKALELYLKLNLDPFDLLNQHGLHNFPSISQRVLSFVRSNPDKAVMLLANNMKFIPVEHVVRQLEPDPKLQLKYLHQLFLDKKGDEVKQFYDLQITLYAEHDPDSLGEFIEKSTTLSINYLDRALEVCTRKNLWAEMVWLQAKMGNIQDALALMVEKVGDVKQAIEFVTKQDDPELWAELIQRSIRNPVFVSGLLENVGTHINPLSLIENIPRGMEIIGLRDRLVKIIYDYNLQMSLKEGCKEVLKSDCKILADKLWAGLRKGSRLETVTKCSTCGEVLLDPKQRGGLVLFFCGHGYHHKCIQSVAAAIQQPENQKSMPASRKMGASASGASATGGIPDVDKNLSCSICRQTTPVQEKRTPRQKS